MTATMTKGQKGPAEGLPFITLPASVARQLCEAAWWPCILAGLPQNREDDSPDWGPEDDTAMEAIRERRQELARIFGGAEVLTRRQTGECKPDDFLSCLVAYAGGAA